MNKRAITTISVGTAFLALLTACGSSTGDAAPSSSAVVAASIAPPSPTDTASPTPTSVGVDPVTACAAIEQAVDEYAPYQRTVALTKRIAKHVRAAKRASDSSNWDRLYEELGAAGIEANRLPDKHLDSPFVEPDLVSSCTDPKVVEEWKSIYNKGTNAETLKRVLVTEIDEEALLNAFVTFVDVYELEQFVDYPDNGKAFRAAAADEFVELAGAIDRILADAGTG